MVSQLTVDLFHISIHALREEGDWEGQREISERKISIHALREEGDILTIISSFHCLIFLSTPSARRATRCGCAPVVVGELISIHALREEGDSKNRDKISIFL